MNLADLNTTVTNPTSSWVLILLVAGSIATSVTTLLRGRSEGRKTRAETESIAQQTTNDALNSYRAYADPLIADLKQQQKESTETIESLKVELTQLRQRVEDAETRAERAERSASVERTPRVPFDPGGAGNPG